MCLPHMTIVAVPTLQGTHHGPWFPQAVLLRKRQGLSKAPIPAGSPGGEGAALHPDHAPRAVHAQPEPRPGCWGAASFGCATAKREKVLAYEPDRSINQYIYNASCQCKSTWTISYLSLADLRNFSSPMRLLRWPLATAGKCRYLSFSLRCSFTSWWRKPQAQNLSPAPEDVPWHGHRDQSRRQKDRYACTPDIYPS